MAKNLELINQNQEIIEQIDENKTEKMANAEVYLHCRGHAAIALNKLHGGNLDTSTVIDRLSKSVDRVLDGNLNEIEAMLITQAKSLEYMFYDAITKLPNASMEHAEVFANIALRAQSGCRKTLMSLAELKHPRRTTTIIKQQNNAINQQVNNGVKSVSQSHKNNKKFANELNAKASYETKMDTGPAVTTSSPNTPAEALGSLNRAKNSRRKDDIAKK